MTHRGNITFNSVECEYDEIFEAYDVGDDIKTSDKILRDYYISSGHFWYFFRKMWFNEECNLNFPGFSKMVGVKKTDYELRSKAVAIIDENIDKIKKGKIIEFKST